jgi:hypothetical protein
MAKESLCFHSSPAHFVIVSDTVTKKILHANAQEFKESKKKSIEKACEAEEAATAEVLANKLTLTFVPPPGCAPNYVRVLYATNA